MTTPCDAGPQKTPSGVCLLELANVKTHFTAYKGFLFARRIGTVRAVDGVSLRLERGQVLGLVGESGCGKSTLARTIMQLIRPSGGSITLDGTDLCMLPHRKLRRFRPAMQMVFQDPYASLNPRMTVFDAIAEPMRVHRLARRKELHAKVSALMERVGLAPRLMRKYPHEFSGGQRQRIAIARTLALNPRLIIADEPVSALDVSVQAQILNLLACLCREDQLTLILISHDLSVVHHVSHRIAVMYLGEIIEIGDAGQVFSQPLHPYTQALLSAVPTTDPGRLRQRERVLLGGDPPSPMNPPTGCRFHPRCPYADPVCSVAHPTLVAKPGDRSVACLLVD